jgi:hypothetical protein
MPARIKLDRRRTRFLGLMLALLVAGLIAGGLVAVRAAGSAPVTVISVAQLAAQNAAPSAPNPPPAATASATVAPQPASGPSPLPALLPQLPSAVSPSSPNHLIIPKLGIDSGWMPLGYLANGVTMDSPPGPADLGWYTFSAQPGTGGNAVFSGHVDWHTGAPALFEHLSSLQAGDEVDVSRSDGSLARYRVESSIWYPVYATAAAPIIAGTPVPTLTLITCGGSFDQTKREYDQRLVVRAQSVAP